MLVECLCVPTQPPTSLTHVDVFDISLLFPLRNQIDRRALDTLLHGHSREPWVASNAVVAINPRPGDSSSLGDISRVIALALVR